MTFDPDQTRDVRWSIRISRREENWLKRRYGSVNKGLIALIVRAMEGPAPDPVYPVEPKSRREADHRRRASRRVGRPPQKEAPRRALDLTLDLSKFHGQEEGSADG